MENMFSHFQLHNSSAELADSTSHLYTHLIVAMKDVPDQNLCLRHPGSVHLSCTMYDKGLR